MNAVTTFVPDRQLNLHQNAAKSWREKRSQLIEAFAECEFAVTKTLSLLSEVDVSGCNIKIKPTLKARFVQLHDLLGNDGGYIKQGRAILGPLQYVQDNIELGSGLIDHNQ